MIVWSKEQQARLAIERQILTQYCSDFDFRDPRDASITTVQGPYISLSKRTYGLAVWVGANFPQTMPSLYVTAPVPLIGYHGREVRAHEEDGVGMHRMHIWSSDWNGYVKICHCKSEYWNPSITISKVLMKGILWLEAYEDHCKTGKYIEDYSLDYD